MEWASRAMSAASKASSNNTVINVFLLGCFGALSIRSVNQQRNIEALEAEKESLVKANKAMKKAMWDWKQQLFAEASADAPLVPLSKLKAIYGEASPLKSAGDAEKGDGKPPVSKILI
ncbi:hypothetical protein F0562_002858 [Nyssa sinensis]|uniref:Uncharacterized protein n=1 Tax=Nyssa sinensis TaxID=561372 RepID=A0A5J5BTJ6_9ASTE|nr:hypothetical protein F0562_002858 [Nyssa sinensis]